MQTCTGIEEQEQEVLNPVLHDLAQVHLALPSLVLLGLPLVGLVLLDLDRVQVASPGMAWLCWTWLDSTRLCRGWFDPGRLLTGVFVLDLKPSTDESVRS